MEPTIFRSLANYLRRERLVCDTRIKVEEKLAFFMYMLSHNASFEDPQLQFGHSNASYHHIMKHFFNVVVPILSNRFLKLPNPNEVPYKILSDSRFYPYFKNCIGAIDGTHIPISVSPDEAAPFRNRKGTLGQNVMMAEAWNKIVKEFHQKNTYVSYTKSQIQEKEKELKREYRMLKEARMQSGVGWNDTRFMIEAEDALWDNLVISFPKINRFKTKSFPLFDALGELYDGQIAEGTYNVNSTQPPTHPDLTQVDDGDELSHTESEFPRFEETWAYSVEQDADLTEHITIEHEDGSVTRNEPRTDESVARTDPKANKRSTATTSRNKEEKETKKPKKQSSNEIAGSMDRYIEMREKQFAIESALLAGEKKGAQSGDYSIKRCISEMMTMALSTDEKAAAVDVFKDPDNREIFLSSKEDDPQVALVWLKKAVAKLS
ncbi:hypothetical protein ACQ4PT_042406 [Festuca glaucescens]